MVGKHLILRLPSHQPNLEELSTGPLKKLILLATMKMHKNFLRKTYKLSKIYLAHNSVVSATEILVKVSKLGLSTSSKLAPQSSHWLSVSSAIALESQLARPLMERNQSRPLRQWVAMWSLTTWSSLSFTRNGQLRKSFSSFKASWSVAWETGSTLLNSMLDPRQPTTAKSTTSPSTTSLRKTIYLPPNKIVLSKAQGKSERLNNKSISKLTNRKRPRLKIELNHSISKGKKKLSKRSKSLHQEVNSSRLTSKISSTWKTETLGDSNILIRFSRHQVKPNS